MPDRGHVAVQAARGAQVPQPGGLVALALGELGQDAVDLGLEAARARLLDQLDRLGQRAVDGGAGAAALLSQHASRVHEASGELDQQPA